MPYIVVSYDLCTCMRQGSMIVQWAPQRGQVPDRVSCECVQPIFREYYACHIHIWQSISD